MRALLSSVGTRGDVQPVLALALALRALGHEAVLCIPPNFVAWAEALGFEAAPVGVAMRAPAASPAAPPPAAPTPEQVQAMIGGLVADQFAQLAGAVPGCDVVVGAGSHQFAARSVAERHGVPYVNAVYAAVSLPSPDLPPRANPGEAWEPGDAAENRRRWDADAQTWNQRYRAPIDEQRAALGLPPVDDVRAHILAERPLLAADHILGPAPTTPGLDVVQTGAWMLADDEPLAPELEAFLEAGEPPVYVGFGSMPAPRSAGEAFIRAARAVGRRAIVSRGWSDLGPIDDAPDCMAIGDVNQQRLFPRVAAVVHHGGAGTTTTAARAGAPQVVAPLFSDQFYWAARIQTLGIGASAASPALDGDGPAEALRAALAPGVAARARATADDVVTNGAAIAAAEIVGRLGG